MKRNKELLEELATAIELIESDLNIYGEVHAYSFTNAFNLAKEVRNREEAARKCADNIIDAIDDDLVRERWTKGLYTLGEIAYLFNKVDVYNEYAELEGLDKINL